MTNLYCGAMTFLALGSPKWIGGCGNSRQVPGPAMDLGLGPPLGGFQLRNDLFPAAHEAISTYIGGLRRMTRESSAFLGVSGGRTKVMEEAVNFRRTYAE